MKTMNPGRVYAKPLGTAPATASGTATPDIDTLATRIYAMVEYGAAERDDPDNHLRLPPNMARHKGDIFAQIAEVQRDFNERLLPKLEGGCGALVHNGGGNDPDSPRHMDLDQWADAEEHGYGGVLPAIVGWLRPWADLVPVQVYVGTVEDDLKRLIAEDEPAAYERALRTVLPLVHAGFEIGFDAAAVYAEYSFGASIVNLARDRGATVYVEALPNSKHVQWQETEGVGVSLRDLTWHKQMTYRNRDEGDAYVQGLRAMPTVRWANERFCSRPENLDREIATVRGILEDGHKAAIPVGSILFQEFGPTARGVVEGVMG